ncbi:MAG: hypothetical protein GXO32_06365 [Crenarchaeota archaeon]|nr:hypothetical protein [Thermoproteota archaeon]
MELAYVLKVESPLLVASTYTKTGPRPVMERIPGSSIAGALARVLAKEFNLSLSELHIRAARGEFVIGDAYPIRVAEGGHLYPSMPAPAFCVKLKVRRVLKNLRIEGSVLCFVKGLTNLDPDKYAEAFKQYLDALNEYLISEGIAYAGLVKPVISVPVVPLRTARLSDLDVLAMDEIDVVSELGIEVRTSVAINPLARRAEEGMLFSYEALSPGNMWWGIAEIPDELANKLCRNPLEICIGKGCSKGFGRARIVFNVIELKEGDSRWFVLWSPLPASNKVMAFTPSDKGFTVLASWSQHRDKPRASVIALRPGVVVWVHGSVEKARARGLEPPWGQAERIHSRELLPPSLVETRRILPQLTKDLR